MFFADVNRAVRAVHAVFHPDRVNYGAYGDTGRHKHFYKNQAEWSGILQMNPGNVFSPRRNRKRASLK